MENATDLRNSNYILQNHIILFDGVCNLCNAVVKFILKNDSKKIFKFGSLQSSEGQNLLELANLPKQDFDTFVYFRKGKCLIKSTAALMVLKEMGGMYGLFYPLIFIPKFIRNSIYELVSKSRYSLWGKKNECMLPNPSFKDRFIS